MKRDGAHMLFIEMLIDLKHVPLAVDTAAEGLMEWRQSFTDDIHHRSVNLHNSPKRCTFDCELGWAITHTESLLVK